MKRNRTLMVAAICVLIICVSVQAFGQFEGKQMRGGLAGGFLIGETEKVDGKISEALRGYIRYNVKEYLDGDLAASYGGIKGEDYQADLWTIEYKFLMKPYTFDKWEPYLGVGFGIAYYYSNASFRAPSVKASGSVGYVPVALGVEYTLTDLIRLDANFSLSYSFSDNIVSSKLTNSNGGGLNDAWWGIFVGVSYTVLGGTQ